MWIRVAATSPTFGKSKMWAYVANFSRHPFTPLENLKSGAIFTISLHNLPKLLSVPDLNLHLYSPFYFSLLSLPFENLKRLPQPPSLPFEKAKRGPIDSFLPQTWLILTTFLHNLLYLLRILNLDPYWRIYFIASSSQIRNYFDMFFFLLSPNPINVPIMTSAPHNPPYFLRILNLDPYWTHPSLLLWKSQMWTYIDNFSSQTTPTFENPKCGPTFTIFLHKLTYVSKSQRWTYIDNFFLEIPLLLGESLMWIYFDKFSSQLPLIFQNPKYGPILTIFSPSFRTFRESQIWTKSDIFLHNVPYLLRVLNVDLYGHFFLNILSYLLSIPKVGLCWLLLFKTLSTFYKTQHGPTLRVPNVELHIWQFFSPNFLNFWEYQIRPILTIFFHNLPYHLRIQNKVLFESPKRMDNFSPQNFLTFWESQIWSYLDKFCPQPSIQFENPK